MITAPRPTAPRPTALTTEAPGSPPMRRRTVLVVMGVAGSGKTTVAHRLADELGWSFAEADDFHPPAHVAAMAAGVPLTDADRWPWLRALRAWIDAVPGDAVLTCSALRRRYRDVLAGADARVRFVHLDGTVEQLSARLSSRIGHFMPASMLDSQLATLERLHPDEDGTVIGIDAPPAALTTRIITAMALR